MCACLSKKESEEGPKKKGACCAAIFESSPAYFLFWYFDGINLFGYRNHHAPTPHAGTPKFIDSKKTLYYIWLLFVFLLALNIYKIENRKSGSIRVQTNEISFEPLDGDYPIGEMLPLQATQYLDLTTLAYEIGSKAILGRPG